ncbi:zf-RING_2 domain-containing protein [Cephalotus follicularis]|uniref:Zf-RING_2 domain-containing protein n=1 Tax=Cephalotus follicularis TaxID=3775 RepID=A0A1Q3BVG1_CEPFO|nr:zf-RING_2 domain-containing protein [Cephalotus follicularis]
MDNEERKQSLGVPFTRELNESDSDYAIAMVLQEQERAFTMLSTIESDSDEESDEVSSDNNNDNYYDEYFTNHDQFEGELEFLDAEDSNSDEDMDDDDDDDELSYEELITLGEVIGVETKGLSLNEISRCLHPCKSQCVDSKNGIDRCVICQVEYEDGEALVALPCQHPYHLDCISQWLQIKKICPICSVEVSSPKIAKNF